MINTLNLILDNLLFKTFLVILTTIYIGYVLQPIPKWLNNLFDTNDIFKFIIIMLVVLTSLHPIDNNKLIVSVVIPIIILYLFKYFRTIDKY